MASFRRVQQEIMSEVDHAIQPSSISLLPPTTNFPHPLVNNRDFMIPRVCKWISLKFLFFQRSNMTFWSTLKWCTLRKVSLNFRDEYHANFPPRHCRKFFVIFWRLKPSSTGQSLRFVYLPIPKWYNVELLSTCLNKHYRAYKCKYVWNLLAFFGVQKFARSGRLSVDIRLNGIEGGIVRLTFLWVLVCEHSIVSSFV